MRYTIIAAVVALLVGCGVLERAGEGSGRASDAALDAAENTLCSPVLGSTTEEIGRRYSDKQKAALREFCAGVDQQ